MKTKLFVVLSLLALTALLVGAAGAQGPGAVALARTLPTGEGAATAALRGSPVLFIENAGQFAEGARFQVRGGDRTLWLADDALWVTVVERESPGAEEPGRGSPLRLRTSAQPSRRGVNIRLSFPGANPHPRLEPFGRLETSVNYFLGNDPARWRTNVPVWGGVRYVDLYPGVDLELTGEGGRIAPRLVCRANCPFVLQNVRLKVEGADSVELAGGEGLRLTTAVGDFTLPLPSTDLALRVERITPDGQSISFHVSRAPSHEAADHRAVTQDNSADLLYATFLGGSGGEWGYAIAVDSAGGAYVTGGTYSSDFPTTPGAFDTSYNDGGSPDAFVVKLNSSGSGLSYATFLGGSDWDRGNGIAVDGAGGAYVTGGTSSSDFPTAPGAFDTSLSGYYDAFVVKLNSSGSGLDYSTFLGGSDLDGGDGIAVDGAGGAYVTGLTWSSDFPTTPGAFDTSYNGGYYDAFVVKLNSSGSGLDYSTFLGGSDWDGGNGIAIDSAGGAYVTGGTYSSDFPTAPGAFDTSLSGYYDAFVVKLNSSGSELSYATFLGGSGGEWGNGIAIDSAGGAYVTGKTYSSDFPTTPGAFDTSYNGLDDAFVVKLNSSGSGLDYSTFLGGSDRDEGNGIAVDGAGGAYVTGGTYSSDFPTTPWAFDMSYNGGYYDAFVVKLNSSGSGLDYSTFLGGSDRDEGNGIAVDGARGAYVTGGTYSSDFPTTPWAFDTSYNGLDDAFVVKLAVGVGHRVYLPLIMRR